MPRTPFFHPRQLTAIRQSCKWRHLLADLGVREDIRRSTDTEFWGYSPFNPDEQTASFHMKAPGIWYDWSAHATAPGRDKPGGGVIELVQCIHAVRGEILKLNEAAAWLVDRGYSYQEEAAQIAEKRQASDHGCGTSAPANEHAPSSGTTSDQTQTAACDASHRKAIPLAAALRERTQAIEVPAPAVQSTPQTQPPSQLTDTPLDNCNPQPSTERTNQPITPDLFPQLSQLGTHDACIQRGISEATCRYLRCGCWDTPRGMLARRLVFQIGSVAADEHGNLQRVILSHTGRATTPRQEQKAKWQFFRGFSKSHELYNIDNLLLDPIAVAQARDTGCLLLVEGAFDVAKLVEAGICNAVASFGSALSDEQASWLSWASCFLTAPLVHVFYDRDEAGMQGASKAVALLHRHDCAATAFDWNQTFVSGRRGSVGIPESIRDPCEFSVAQLQWLREKGVLS